MAAGNIIAIILQSATKTARSAETNAVTSVAGRIVTSNWIARGCMLNECVLRRTAAENAQVGI
jgi:hypothetical protein